ncbi:hypothetical protein THAOC_13156 [Thalassiosira oceanica]|uniref:Uncharacterized protein n=1 Tax=Thalassiosira oceanica TaxID=159749 RepID=K0SKT9_THAOC|nr:hypothetical protein THAOC_13156 [Thalassiosira oceanica]|eukprot:EJK65945.1 hypothetical protein THAOC_13156 [Thalassiosira oceanica]
MSSMSKIMDHGPPRGHLANNIPLEKSKKQVSLIPKGSPPSCNSSRWWSEALRAASYVHSTTARTCTYTWNPTH